MDLATEIALAGLFIAVITTIVTTIFQIVEHRHSRFSLGVDLLLRLDERFVGDEMKRIRKAAAKGILERDYTKVDEVFDFFEMVALLVQRGAIDSELVWMEFAYWIEGYLQTATPRIKEMQNVEDTLWEDVFNLRRSFEKYEGKGNVSSVEEWTAERKKAFLEEETRLP